MSSPLFKKMMVGAFVINGVAAIAFHFVFSDRGDALHEQNAGFRSTQGREQAKMVQRKLCSSSHLSSC